MYLQFFGLNEAPFAITPDPAFVYLSEAHREALAHLLYGVGQGGSGGFVQLTGEVGTGKTTLCRCLLEQIPDDARVALVLNPLMTPQELLATICEELGIDTAGIEHSNKALVDRLNRYLLEQHAGGRRVVVVIDEAQNLSPEALEQVRLLTNLETAKEKLLQMVLLGQPELRRLLQRQDLRQLAQRITARYHLTPLDQEQTAAYVRHRMKVAGATRSPFRSSALRALYRRSGGVPRLINIIADRSLTAAYARESRSVTAATVNRAANEVQPAEDRVQPLLWPRMAAALALALLVTAAYFWGQPYLAETPAAPAAAPDLSAAGAAVERENAVAPAGPGGEAGLPDVAGDAVGAPVSADILPGQQSTGFDWNAVARGNAWQGLAELWHDADHVREIQAACDDVSGTGYACLKDYGSWSRIRKLGLPVILVLRGNQPGFLLLRGFAGDDLLVGQGSEPVRIPRAVVEKDWLGEYMVAWPQASDWPAQIRRGEAGAAVDIVMQMASFADPPWHGGSVFDREFEAWLTAFQQRNGLRPDGIIGPATLIRLMAPTISDPRLIESSAEGS